MMVDRVPIAGQIAEVKRELALRSTTYPRLVASGKLRQSEADLCTGRMQSVLATLMFCQTHEADIRAFIQAKHEATS